jgi:putative membrane protein insertion efficiency factor
MRYDPVRYLLLGLIRCYQLLVSPMLGPTCRFYPSCSAYGYQAVRDHGSLRGTWLTIRRLLRCHPWNPGGIDPVPPRRRQHPPDHSPDCPTTQPEVARGSTAHDRAAGRPGITVQGV